MLLMNENDRERAELYRFFAVCFMMLPTDEVLMQFRDMFRVRFSETQAEIGMDFAHIFIGPWKHLPPYESVYSFSPGDIPGSWSRIAREVQAFYRSTGLVLHQQADLSPDHLSAELLFMSYLTENDLMEYQRIFFERHLFRWVPDYCDLVYGHAFTSFYKEVANLLKKFILFEYEELEIHKGYSESFP